MLDAQEKKGNIDPIDWLLIAKHYANSQDEEVAFNAYYMAHLLDHKKFRTNSELQFSTNQVGGSKFKQIGVETQEELQGVPTARIKNID